MIYDGQTITLSVDYEPKEINRSFLFAIENNSWFDYISESTGRINIASILFFFVFYFYGLAFIFSVFLSIITAVIVTVFVPIIVFYLTLKIGEYLSTDITSMKGEPITLLITYYFDNEGIKWMTDSRKIEHLWSKTSKVIENEKELFIFYNKLNCYLIPKRVFSNFKELNQFRNFLKLKLGNKAEF